MKKVSEFVQKIEKQYVGDDCIQIMVPYTDAITVFNQEGILFHSKNKSNLAINKYLEDERRKLFPYSNIPTHYSKVGFGKKVTYSNQLFNFEQPYIRILDNLIVESYVINDNDNALLINSILQPNNHCTEYMTYDQLLDFTAKDKLPNQKTYYAFLNGSLLSDKVPIFPTEEEIKKYIYDCLIEIYEDLKVYSEINNIHYHHDLLFNFLEHNIEKLDLSMMDFNINIGYEPTLLVIRISDNCITIQGVKVTFVRKNKYKVDIYDIPVNKYSLEQLKYLPQIKITREPKIPLKLNPGVTKQDILEAKQMVKSLKR